MIRNNISIGEWKIQLAISTQFISSRNPEQFRIRHSNSENIEIMSCSDINDVVKDLLITLKENYTNDLTRMEGSEYHFERVVLLRYKFHKIGLRRGGSYIDFPKWIKNKKGTVNPKNENDKCFIYAIIASLNHDKIDNHPERISNLKPYINGYNWHGLEFPAKPSDWRKFEQNNRSIALNILFVPNGTKDIGLAYKSKYNDKRESKVILLMIGDCEKWYYLAVKNLPRLLRGISSNYVGDDYCLGCFHSYSTPNKLKKHERLCNNHNFCETEMPTEKDKILKYSHGEKSLRVLAAYYCDIESLIKKIDTCRNNPEQSSTTRVSKHKPCGFSIVAKSSLTNIREENTCYRSKDCMKKYYKKLREWVMKIVNYEMNKMIPLTEDENDYHEKQNKCITCYKRFCYYNDSKNFKNYRKVCDHCHYTSKYRGAAHSICNLQI